MSTLSTTNSEGTLTVPKTDITYTIDITPHHVIEYMDKLVCQAFHYSWGEMGTEDLPNGKERWIFRFTREDFRRMKGTNPFGDVEELWVFCTFEGNGIEPLYDVEVDPAHVS